MSRTVFVVVRHEDISGFDPCVRSSAVAVFQTQWYAERFIDRQDLVGDSISYTLQEFEVEDT